MLVAPPALKTMKRILSYSILSYPIYPIPSYPILFLPCLTVSHPVLTRTIRGR